MGPTDHINIRILQSGSKPNIKGIPTIVVCGIRRVMWSVGPLTFAVWTVWSWLVGLFCKPLNWVAVEELKLRYHCEGAPLVAIDPCWDNLL